MLQSWRGWRGRWRRRSLLSERTGQRGWVLHRHDSDFKKKKQRKKKVRPWSIPALCSLHFLLLNFHQPPHNNMADPACGTGATQLELQTEIRLLQLVWDQPRQEMMTEGETREEIRIERKERNKIRRLRTDRSVKWRKASFTKGTKCAALSITNTGLGRPLLVDHLLLQFRGRTARRIAPVVSRLTFTGMHFT